MRRELPPNVQLTGATLNKHFVTEICPDRKTHKPALWLKPIPFIRKEEGKKLNEKRKYCHKALKSFKAKDRQTIPQALVTHAFLYFFPLLCFLQSTT